MSRTGGTAFNRKTVLGLLVVSFVAFLAMLYFISAGNTSGSRNNDGRAHAASNGLNGYAGLVQLLQAEGVSVKRSRSPSGYETYGLLVLTPPPYADAEDISDILEDRQYVGPTLVILPKWYAAGMPDSLPDELKGKVKDGWVQLQGASAPGWAKDLPAPYDFDVGFDDTTKPYRWNGLDLTGQLPTSQLAFGQNLTAQQAIVTDQEGGALALEVIGEEGTDFYDEAHGAIFVVEPDLVNNYGLADPERAALALELVRYAGYYDEAMPVTFDLTLNGFGGSTNLLTLAFRPPFLAATLCLILALIIIGWRAFQRFGPPSAEGPAIAFGKSRLIANGAGLILRARRTRLLAEPYIALSQRRLSRMLGLTHPEPAMIDAALARRLPQEKPFTHRASELRSARRDADILRAAAALKDLEGKLQK